jgi:hypothetical protein
MFSHSFIPTKILHPVSEQFWKKAQRSKNAILECERRAHRSGDPASRNDDFEMIVRIATRLRLTVVDCLGNQRANGAAVKLICDQSD